MSDYLTTPRNWDLDEGRDEDYEKRQLPEGIHLVKIARVVTERGDGSRISTSKGDPCLMVVYEDQDGREGVELHTLSEKGDWTLRRLLKRFDVDTKALTKRGIKPADWLDPVFANGTLVGKTGYIRVAKGSNGRLRAEPMNQEEADKAMKVIKEVAAVNAKFATNPDDDMPF